MILINMWLLSIVISHQTLELHARNAIYNENNRQNLYTGYNNGEDNPSIDGFERTHRTHKYQMMLRKVAAARPDVMNGRSSGRGRTYDFSSKPAMLYERVYTTVGLRAKSPGPRDVKPVKRFHAVVSDEPGSTQLTAVRPSDGTPNTGPTTTSCLGYSPGTSSLSFSSSPDPNPTQSTVADQPEEPSTSVVDNDVSSSLSSRKPSEYVTSTMADDACAGSHETDVRLDDGESSRSTISLPSTSTVGPKPNNVFRHSYIGFTTTTVGGPDGQRIFYYRIGSTNRHKYYSHVGRCNRHRFRTDRNTVPPSNILGGRRLRIIDQAKDDGSTDPAKADGSTDPAKADGSTDPAKADGSTTEPTKFPPKSGFLGSICSTCSKPVNPTYTFIQAKPTHLTTPVPTRKRTQTLITVYEPMLVTRHYDTHRDV